MKESCMQKVREKFEVLPEQEITKHSMYVDNGGKFCFNAMVLDICAGLEPLPQNNNKVSERLLQEGIYEQDDTRSIIDHIHSSLIEENIEFDEAKDLVLSALGNDGDNDFDSWAESHSYLSRNDYEDDFEEDYDDEN